MKNLIQLLLILIATVFSFNSLAQKPKMNRISLESGSGIGGVVGVSYERRIVKKLAVFGGVSILPNSIDEPFGYAFGIRLVPKENNAGFVTSISFGTGTVSIGSDQAGYDYSKGISLLIGYRFMIKQIVDIELGIGVEYITEHPSSGISNTPISITVVNDWVIAANLAIGYHF